MFRWLAVVVLACASVVGGSGTVGAQERTHEPPPEAVQFFESGRAHYEAGRYQEAANDLERALQLDPSSTTLIFNLARVYELLGELDKAVEFAERYLTLLPEDMTEERERAESTLRRVRGAQEWLALRQSEHPPELRTLTPTVIVRERGVVDLPFWVTAGTGAALLLAGAGTGVGALLVRNDARDFVLRTGNDREEQQSLVDRADRLALATDILIGVGAATAVAGLLLYLLRVRTFERELDPESDAPEGEVAVSVGPGQISLEATF